MHEKIYKIPVIESKNVKTFINRENESNKLLKLNPDDLRALFNNAHVCFELNKDEEDLNKLINEIGLSNVFELKKRADIYILLARLDLDKLLDIEPENANTLMMR
ncbi:hypothetical protein F8M41_018029 [Gigaspora margarita]|uniref:Uncharacterized protein n=1 Tax=Gigaspora margarita TaxID=4874 RepID=A0A8H4AMC3_GIGMA|nr:hypothetical protein F8M41_018029 [Gigaspora margarita]